MSCRHFRVARMFPGIFERHAVRISARYHEESDCVDFAIEDAGVGISVEEFQEHILKTREQLEESKKI